MEFRDLKTQYKVLKPQLDMAIKEVLNECDFISGHQVKDLEYSLAEYVGVKHCITCANGTDALSLALAAANIGSGDAVFVADFTFFASAEVIACSGATPVFVDVDENTFNLDTAKLKTAIQAVIDEGQLRPKAVIAVDLFGLPANYTAIKQITEQFGLLLIEDCAQGFGGNIAGRRAGSFGDIATTSFFPAKPLGCYGDGGAVFCDNDEYAALVRSLAVHGKGTDKYDNVCIGRNSRLDTLQAAILQVKLKAFAEYELADVNKAAALYTQYLGDSVKTPIVPDSFASSWAQYTIQLADSAQRQRIQTALKSNDIPSMVYYPKAIHQQTAFADVTLYNTCPVTERLCETVLSLPMHPYLNKEDIRCVAEKIIIALK